MSSSIERFRDLRPAVGLSLVVTLVAFHGRQKITLSSGQEMLIRITAR